MADTLEEVRWKIESEGFDYAFRYYSNFEEVEDPDFHRLRRAYVAAAQALDDYIPQVEEEGEDG
jgi:hypothetical protein